MASSKLGTLTIDLIAEFGGFISGLKTAEKQADSSSSKIKSDFSGIRNSVNGIGEHISDQFKDIGKNIIGFLAVESILESFKTIIEGGIEMGDKLDEMSARYGESVENLSKLNYVGAMMGLEPDELMNAYTKLSIKMSEANDKASEASKTFKDLGLSVKDSNGDMKSTSDFLKELSDKLKDFKEDANKTALEVELFGKSGKDLGEFLNLGSEGMENLTNKAKELGFEISGDTASAAAEFNDKIGELKLGLSTMGLEIAEQLLPKLTGLLENFQENMKSGEVLKNIIDFLSGAFDLLTIAVGAVNVIFGVLKMTTSALIGVVGLLFTNLGNVLSLFKNLFTKGPIEAFNQYIASTKNNITTSGEFINAEWSKASKQIKDGGKKIINTINGVSDSTKKLDTKTSETSKTLKSFKKTIDDGDDSHKKLGKTAKANKDSLTEEQKAAEQLHKTYQNLINGLNEQIGTFGMTKEFDKNLWKIQNGNLKGGTKEDQDELLRLSKISDEQKEQAEIQKKADDLAKKAKEEREKELEDMQKMSEEMDYQLQILGKTKDEQEMIRLQKDLGKNATTEEGLLLQAQLANLQNLSAESEKMISLQDSLRDATKSSITGLINGTKSLKSAITDIFDSILSKITDIISTNFTNYLFGMSGSSQNGAFGGFFNSFFSLFSGARANGGDVFPNSLYKVNERGPEILSIGGSDFLMMGKNGGKVLPNTNNNYNKNNQIVNFNLNQNIDRRTQNQIAFETYRSMNLATSRNK